MLGDSVAPVVNDDLACAIFIFNVGHPLASKKMHRWPVSRALWCEQGKARAHMSTNWVHSVLLVEVVPAVLLWLLPLLENV